jgi:hypothetical protein
MRFRTLTIALGLLLVAAAATTALAGHQTSGVRHYTGCLVSGDGVMIKIKEGTAPRSACQGGLVEAHFSGGDITKISVGGGLTLPNGGDNGEVRIELGAGQTLPQCSTAGRVVEWSGSTWVCGVDDDTTYTASTGLDLSAGNAFSIDSAFRIPGKTCSTSGNFARGFDASGNIQCAGPPTSSGARAYSASVGAVTIGGSTTVISKELPRGLYLIFATVEIKNKDDDSPSAMDHCAIPGYTTSESIGMDAGRSVFVSLVSAISHSGGAVALMCDEFIADVDVASATLSAIEVGSIG